MWVWNFQTWLWYVFIYETKLSSLASLFAEMW